MGCHECDNGFECCHELSVQHADGTSECWGEEPCTLDHELHLWVGECSGGGCTTCVPEAEHDEMLLPFAA